jgi:hypothetical protein
MRIRVRPGHVQHWPTSAGVANTRATLLVRPRGLDLSLSRAQRRNVILTFFEGVQTRAKKVLLLCLSLFSLFAADLKKERSGGKCCHAKKYDRQ